MRYINKLAGIALLMLLAGCGSSSGEGNGLVMDTTIQPPATTTTATTNSTTNNNNIAAPITAPAAVNSGPLNPKHGQPGHRCDIPEGSPLNSQPTTQTTAATVPGASPAVFSQPAAISTPVAKTTTTTSPSGAGLNPAHGQPGHRCEIAVGAPLDSKPASTPATTTTTTTTPLALNPSVPAATPITSPAAPAKTQTAVPTAPGMNPAHGQPGHRCDIAVGAPLNSKSTPPVNKTETAVNNPSPADSKTMTPAEKEAYEKEKAIFEKNKEADKAPAPVKGN